MWQMQLCERKINKNTKLLFLVMLYALLNALYLQHKIEKCSTYKRFI